MARPFPHPSGDDFSYTVYLPGAGNGAEVKINFPATTSLQLQAIPQYDEANRMIKYLRYRLTVDVVLVADDVTGAVGMDAAMTTIKKVLSTPGGSLKLYSLGLGTSFGSSSTTDLAFGPHPLELRLRPCGGQSVHVYWAVEFTLPLCDVSDNPVDPISFTYTLEFTLDQSGLATRMIAVQAEFPVKRNAARTNIVGSADNLTGFKIKPPRLPGFHREHRRILSPDKRSLTYLITDTEIASDNAYALGMVKMDIRQRVRNTLSILTAGNFIIDMTGTLEHAAGFTKAQCWEAFRLIVRDRLRNASQAVMPTTDSKKSSLILMTMNIEDELFARRISVSVTWRLMCNLDTLLRATGLFQPTTDTWAVWTAGMEEKIPPTGRFDMRHKEGQDVLMNLCQPGQLRKDIEQGKGSPSFNPTAISANKPNDDSGWDWYPIMSLYRKTGAMVVSTTGGGSSASRVTITQQSTAAGAAAKNFLSGFASGFSAVASAGASAGAGYFVGTTAAKAVTDNTIHDRTGPYYELVFRGSATRLNTPPPIPYIKSVGGQAPVSLEEKVDPAVVVMLTASGPIYKVNWFYRYSIPKFEGDVKVEIENAPPTNNLTTLSSSQVQ